MDKIKVIIGCLIICLLHPYYAYSVTYKENFIVQTTKQLMADYFAHKYDPGYELFSNEIPIYVKSSDITCVKENLNASKRILQDFAKIIYRESRGESIETRAAIVWTILNRYDKGYAKTLEKVYKAPYQFAYVKNTPIIDIHYEVAKDVYTRWLLEHLGYSNVGRILPKEYCFYAAKNRVTRFRKEYDSIDHWNWSLESPYDSRKTSTK